MPALLPDVDPDGLLEYSVVYTDRALNHMSRSFQQTMTELSRTLKNVYHAHAVAVVPGSGTFGMEAVARQLATGKKCLVVRNGWFSYRWSQIFEMGGIPAETLVLKARRTGNEPRSPWAPVPIEELTATVGREQPHLVFAPHVETSSGMMLPDDYICTAAAAVHEHGGLFVLDCIASGTVWIDMEALGVDVLISAPQKGWSGSPCCGLVMLSERATKATQESTSTSFAMDLRKWLDIMAAYEAGGHAYHATMPTDGLRVLSDVMAETEAMGFDAVKTAQLELGRRVRALLAERGIASVAAPGFEAPGVVVAYTDDDDVKSGRSFSEAGVQIAAGVPLQCDEPADFKTFRIGLFGLDKLADVDQAVDRFQQTLDRVGL
ncbi:MAG: aminotransferase class V-fold PLP-dependent enzyme [Pseudomonadales bacterium]